MMNGEPKQIECIDCHMPAASKSAIGMAVGNGWRGDVKTHIMNINTDAVTKDAMFDDEGAYVALDENGQAAVTLDFACLQCHTKRDVEWAAGFADDIHENGINTDVETSDIASFDLKQNYPNPVNSKTTIEFYLANPTNVELKLMDASGQEVETLIRNYMPAGDHQLQLDSRSLPNGVYIYTIQTKEFSASKKMIILR